MKALVCLIVAVVVLAGLVQSGLAATLNFTVPAGEESVRTLNLAVEDRVLVRFTVVGQSEHVIDFSIAAPDGKTMVEYRHYGSVDYSFVCNATGEYRLCFSNVQSLEDKFVTLDYEVQHYIFGIPQLLFLTLVIVAICLAMVAAFIFLSKLR